MPKSNTRTKVPDGWDKCSNLGERVPGTPIVAFKVPLQAAFHREWGVGELVDSCNHLVMVVDLTATDRSGLPTGNPRCISPSANEETSEEPLISITCFNRSLSQHTKAKNENPRSIYINQR